MSPDIRDPQKEVRRAPPKRERVPHSDCGVVPTPVTDPLDVTAPPLEAVAVPPPVEPDGIDPEVAAYFTAFTKRISQQKRRGRPSPLQPVDYGVGVGKGGVSVEEQKAVYGGVVGCANCGSDRIMRGSCNDCGWIEP